MDVVEEVEVHGDELTIRVGNGAADIGNVALVLSQSGVRLLETTLRTPTLDDVFLQVTGNRLEVDAPVEEVLRERRGRGKRPYPRPASGLSG